MKLELKRYIKGKMYNIRLTGKEMEKAYRMQHYSYLEEDFLRAFEDSAENWYIPITYEHLVQYPLIMDWLCEHYDYYFDANMSHNDLIELVFHKLNVKLRDFDGDGIADFADSLAA